MEWWIYPLLLATGLAAGLVDAVAGGGGILTLPVLLSVGFPPQLAFGTNKLQASFGSSTAAWHYARSGLVEVRSCRVGILATLVGAVTGAMAVQWFEPTTLQRVVPWLLAAVVVYMLIRREMGVAARPARMRLSVFFIIFGLILGFYDGFLGPGTGTFWTVLMISLLGFDFLKATATTKLLNATSNFAALTFFVHHGSVGYAAGLAMGGGQLVGARLGARLAIARGARFIRPIFLMIAALLVLRLVWAQFGPART